MIEFSNLIFRYSEQKLQRNKHNSEIANRILLNIPFWQLEAEERLFLHGPSGSGKSTVLNLLSGLLAPTSGKIQINGQITSDMNSRQRDAFRAQNIGYVFQAFNLVPYLNPIENIQLAAYFNANQTNSFDSIQDYLTRLNIDQSQWQKPCSSLSIGQQQRVAIARALINSPKLLLADEPTSALDQANRDAFMALLMELAQEKAMTLVFVSHDLSLAHYFSRAESLNDLNANTNERLGSLDVF